VLAFYPCDCAVFRFARAISVDAGCRWLQVAKVEPTSLDSGSIRKGKWGVEGLRVVLVYRQPYAIAICFVVELFFVVCVGQWHSSAVFRGFYSPCGANKPTPSIASNESGNTHLHYTPPSLFLPPHACRRSFNIEKPCLHPSLEGRGNRVVVCNAVLAPLEWWRKDLCSNETQSVQENM
jgi:hypothetical protein